MKLFGLVLVLLAAVSTALAGDCTPEKYEVVTNVFFNVNRCKGELQVYPLGSDSSKNDEGKLVNETQFSFSNNEGNTFTFSRLRFEDGAAIDANELLTVTLEDRKNEISRKLDQLHPADRDIYGKMNHWYVKSDVSRDWPGDGSGSDFPSRTIVWMLDSYSVLDRDHVQQTTYPRFYLLRYIVDKHNNNLYIIHIDTWMSFYFDDEKIMDSMQVKWQN